MIGNFYDNFSKKETPREIPQEVLDVVNRKLPKQLAYYQDEKGCVLRPVPESDIMNSPMLASMVFGENVPAELKNLPRDKWLEYLYRTQKRIEVKNVRMKLGDAEWEIRDMVGNPLVKHDDFEKLEMVPEKFPPARPVHLETEDGTKVEMLVGRQPYESMNEIMLANETFPALRLEWYYHEEKESLRMKITVSASKAETVTDAVAALKIFLGFYDGTLTINQLKMPGKMKVDEADDEVFRKQLEFWEKAQELEKILNVSFTPSADFPEEDRLFFEELNRCLLEKKALTFKHPFFEFTGTGVNFYGHKKEEVLNRPGTSFLFMESPGRGTLLGAEFPIYSVCRMSGFMITDIIEEGKISSKGQNEARILINDAGEEPWILKRQYFASEKEAVEEYKRLNEMERKKEKQSAQQ